ncbi:MAG: hypothetical protein IPK82_08330 [Polyangiaceae bacterium]|nr:hypothetical protein [Polyangiaceae bacterium]
MKRDLALISLAATLLTAGACTKDDPNSLLPSGGNGTAGCPSTSGPTGTGGDSGSGGSGASTASTGTAGSTGSTNTLPPENPILAERVVSYTEALRTASFKLVGNAPTLEEMMSVENAPTIEGKKALYEELVDKMMADVRFKRRLVEVWRNTFRQAGAAAGQTPSRDTAPNFAARIVFEKKAFTDLFLATSNTCPTFNGTDFADGDCAPNGPDGMTTVGILTDPGIHAQYYGNLAFRRVRLFQEVFACRKNPAEYAPDASMPPPIAGCEMAQTYTSPWDFTKIGGHTNTGRIDFQDCSSVICGNCHGTINHRAPLFANFDEHGQYQPQYSVLLPLVGTPAAVYTDFLVEGEPTGWKVDMPASNLMELGQAMAADEEVLQCAVTRVWNYAMSKGDVVVDSASLSPDIIAPLVQKFKASGYNLNATWRDVFVHEDFVRF